MEKKEKTLYVSDITKHEPISKAKHKIWYSIRPLLKVKAYCRNCGHFQDAYIEFGEYIGSKDCESCGWKGLQALN